MGRKPRNTERGSRVQHEKCKRRDAFLRTFRSKTANPALSLTALAKQERLGRSQVFLRWKQYSSAVDDAGRMAACENHSGGHNRTFTPAQSALLADQVLALNAATYSAIRDVALEMKNSIDSEHAAVAHRRHLRSDPPEFVASASFITRLKRQYRMSSIRAKLVHQRRPAAADADGAVRDEEREAEEYLVEVNCAINDFGARMVLNMDETPVKLAEVPRTAIRRTNSREAAKITTHVNERLNITTFPTISAGGDKLKMCAIIQGTTERTLRKATADASDTAKRVQLYYSETGWINQGIMLQYLKDVVEPYTRGQPAALIMDDYKAHWTPAVQAAAAVMNLLLIHVPNFKGATAMLQPLDAQFNGPLKGKRMKLWAAYHARVPDAADSYAQMVERIQLAYNEMTKDDVILAFRKALISV